MMESPPWLICRHELPAYGARVLLCYQLRSSMTRECVIGTRACTDAKGEHWQDDHGKSIDANCVVYAWMPLPSVTFES